METYKQLPTALTLLVCRASVNGQNFWHLIDWAEVRRRVSSLQARIVKAVQLMLHPTCHAQVHQVPELNAALLKKIKAL